MTKTMLQQACEAAWDRQMAVLGRERDATNLGEDLNEQQIRAALSGLDIDFDDFIQQSHNRTLLSLVAVVRGEADLDMVLRGVWFDGILTGHMLSRLQAKKHQAERRS